mmetsp:Transcript_15087/g.25720  ORF Transcript_15087/g.25720 Transcript_15087/m.25720 type:complete len:98 (+) Transcript_15087:17-310(+)
MGGVERERERRHPEGFVHREILQFEISVAKKTSLSLLEHVSVDSNSPHSPSDTRTLLPHEISPISLLCSVVFDSASTSYTRKTNPVLIVYYSLALSS